MPTAYVVMSCR